MPFKDLKAQYGKILVVLMSFLCGMALFAIVMNISTPNEIKLREGKAYVKSEIFDFPSFSVINGEMKYYANEIIPPEQTENHEFSYKALKKDEFVRQNEYLSSTFEFSMEMEKDREDLVMGMYANPFKELTIWVNGQKAYEYGKSGFDPFEINCISTREKKLEVVINIKSKGTRTIEAGEKLLFMTSRYNYYRMAFIRDLKDMIMIGGILFLGIYNLIFYSMLKQKKLLIFAMISIFGALRVFFSNTVIKNCFAFNSDIETYMFVQSMLTSTALIAFLIYLTDICQNAFIQKVLKISVLLLISSCCMMIPDDFFWWNKKYELFVYILVLFVSLSVIIRSYFKGHSKGEILVIGGCFSILLIVADIFMKNFLVIIEPDIDLSGMGLIFFMVCLAIVTSKELARSYIISEKLSVENRQMSTELKLLDRRLERRMSNQTEFLMKIIGSLESDKKMLEAEMREMESQIAEHKIAREEISNAYEKIASLSFTDQLTGIYNRRGFLRWISLNHLGNRFVPFCVAIGDIDDFKQINDMYGHNFGDGVLVSISGILNSNPDKNSCVARWGGEEFIMVLPFEPEEEFKLRMDNIRERISAEKFHIGNKKISITMTFGIARVDRKMDVEDIVEIVDKLLYVGKKSGKNTIIM